MILALVARDLRRTVARPAEAALPTLFFLLVGVAFAFALGPAPALLAIPWGDAPRLALALALGSLGLAALANLVAALTVGARGGGGLVALLVVPLALPVLIFGSSLGEPGALRLVAAASLLLAALSPFATAAALRLART